MVSSLNVQKAIFAQGTKTHDMPVISILRKYKNIHQCAAAA